VALRELNMDNLWAGGGVGYYISFADLKEPNISLLRPFVALYQWVS
jgi:hypothetical protein